MKGGGVAGVQRGTRTWMGVACANVDREEDGAW